MSDIDRTVFHHATKNAGVITQDQAIALGMSDRTIRRRVAEGQLTKLGYGILALPGVFAAEETSLRAAIAGIGAIVSHESGARIHGLRGLKENIWSVSVPIRRTNRFGSLRVHQLTDLEPSHVMEIEGMPVTDPERTILDLAAVLPPKKLADLTDQCVTRGLSTYTRIGETLEKLARRGKPGVAKLRKVLEARSTTENAPASTLETLVFDLLASGGLPEPTTQFRAPWLRRRSGRVDLAYIQARLVIEADSRRWHDSPEAFQADRERDNLAQLAGWTILRFTWEDVTRRQTYVLETVSAALRRGEFVSGQIWPDKP